MTKLAKGRHKVLIHLEAQKSLQEIRDHEKISYEVCQKGIVESVNLSGARVSQLIKDMIKKGLIEEDVRRVVGIKRRCNVYSLTPKGLERTKEIRKQLENKKVILKKNSSEYNVKLGKIESHINYKNPLLVALNNINNDGVIDLSLKERQKKGDIFVGRKDEMEYLSKKLDLVKKDNSLTVLIEGEDGIGKTRLVNELKQRAISNNFEFLTGKGYYDSSEPYLPFKKAFKIYQNKNKDITTPLRLSREEHGRVEKNHKNIEKIERKRDLIFSETAENIRKLAENRPIVIFIDDLQWADKATLMLFHYLSDNLGDSPVLLVGAFPPISISDNDFLDEVLQRMRKDDLFDELELGPLKWVDTRKISQKLTGRKDIPDEFVQLVQNLSEGNPLFSKEIIKEMLKEGTVDPKNNKYPTSKVDIELSEMSEIVDDIIDKKIKRLDQEDLQILQISSVIGEDIRFSLLQSITNIDPFDLLDSVGMITRTGIWEEDPKEDMFYFAHGLIHKYVYERIPRSLKKTIHGQVGESMEKEFEQNIEKYYSDIGFHYKRADEFDKGFEFYRKAGEKAESLYAHEDAIDMYEQALELFKEGELTDKKRWKVLEKLGDIHKIIGKHDKSKKYYDKITLDKRNTKYQQKIYRKKAAVFEREGNFGKALETIEKGLGEQYKESIENCKLLFRKGLIKTRQGKYDQAEKDFLKALEISKNIGSDKEIALIYQGLGIIYNNKGIYDDSLDYFKEALGKLEKIEDLKLEASVLNNMGNVFLNRSDLDKALGYFERSLEIRKKVGDKCDIASTLNNIGVVYLNKCHLKRSMEYHQKSHKISKEIGDQEGIAGSLINIGESLLMRGNLDMALENLKKSLDICEKINLSRGSAIALINLGSIYLQKGDLDEAKKTYREGFTLCESIGYKRNLPHLLNGLADIDIKEGNVEKALLKGKKALGMSITIGAKVEEGMSHGLLGKAYREKKEWDKAKKEFEEGKKILEQHYKENSELAELLYHYALFWKDKGEDKKSREYMEEAHSMFEEMGMEYWIKKCEEELE